MADLATLRRTDAARLTRGERREVVVVHVTLGGLRRQRVEALLHVQHVQRGDAQNLGFAALEQGGTVNARDHCDLGGQCADVAGTTSVDADALGERAVTHDLLGQRLHGCRHLAGAVSEAIGQLLRDVLANGVRGFVALLLAGDLHGLGNTGGCKLLYGCEDIVLVVAEHGKVEGFARQLGHELGLGIAQDLDERLRSLEALAHDLFRGSGLPGAHEFPCGFGSAGFHHGDGDIAVGQHAPGNNHLESRPLGLLDRGEAHPCVVDEGNANGADGAGERQSGQRGGDRGRVDRDDVVQVSGVQREHVDDDLDLVAQTLDEGGAQRAVDQACREDGAFAGTAFATEERAGDAASGVHTLFNINREREEVEVFPRLLGRGGGGEQHGVAVEVDSGRAVGLLREQSGFKPDDVAAVGTVVDDCFGEFETWSFHGQAPFSGGDAALLGQCCPLGPPVFDRGSRGPRPHV